MDFLQLEAPWGVVFLFIFGAGGTGALGFAVAMINKWLGTRRKDRSERERSERKAQEAETRMLVAKAERRIAESERKAAEAIHRSVDRTARMLREYYGVVIVDSEPLGSD